MEEKSMNTEAQLVRFDWAIKHLLRDKANFDVLEGFLTALLKENIEILEILESESNQTDSTDKFNRVDLLVKDSQQRQIVIEIQNYQTPDYLERLLYGVSKVIVDNIQLGEDCRNITKVIVIGVLYFNFGEGDDYVYYSASNLRGVHAGEIFSFLRLGDDKKYHSLQCKDIYPEYYLIHVERFQDVIGSDLDEWIYMLKHSAVPANFKAKNIDIARKKLALMGMSQEERQTYERYVMAMVENQSVLEAARSEGEQRGLQKGLQKGRDEGLQKGRDEGEANARLEMAKKMQESGMDIETIASLTGLNPDELHA
jgi:predicted transposase/invertase (TIGR01784 family)